MALIGQTNVKPNKGENLPSSSSLFLSYVLYKMSNLQAAVWG